MAAKLGYIDYLNSLPIYYGLETGAVPLPAGVELVKAPPTTLNAAMARGELDVSPMSSIAFAQDADKLVLLPDLSINSTGFVHSVSLFFRNGLDSLRGGKIAVTGESATSVVLLKILLQKRLHLDAQIVTGEADLDTAELRSGLSRPAPAGADLDTAELRSGLSRPAPAGADLEEIGHSCDGVLLIGDSALRASLAYPSLGRLDLADEWTRWTGTPMVFAVWGARHRFAEEAPASLRDIHAALLAGKAWGRANKGVIVEHARRKLFLSRAFMERYFRDLNYDLDAPKLAGLARYYELAHEIGAIPRVPRLAPQAVSR